MSGREGAAVYLKEMPLRVVRQLVVVVNVLEAPGRAVEELLGVVCENKQIKVINQSQSAVEGGGCGDDEMIPFPLSAIAPSRKSATHEG